MSCPPQVEWYPPQKDILKSSMPSTSKGDLIWKVDLYRGNQAQVRSQGGSLIQSDCCPYKGGHLDVRIEERCCKATGRRWSLTSQGTPGTPEAGGGEQGPSPGTFRGTRAQPTPWCLASGCQNSKTMRLWCSKAPSVWYLQQL